MKPSTSTSKETRLGELKKLLSIPYRKATRNGRPVVAARVAVAVFGTSLPSWRGLIKRSPRKFLITGNETSATSRSRREPLVLCWTAARTS